MVFSRQTPHWGKKGNSVWWHYSVVATETGTTPIIQHPSSWTRQHSACLCLKKTSYSIIRMASRAFLLEVVIHLYLIYNIRPILSLPSEHFFLKKISQAMTWKPCSYLVDVLECAQWANLTAWFHPPLSAWHKSTHPTNTASENIPSSSGK